jgi:hypothetical protein
MSLQKGEFEKDNLKLHLCNSVYEAYSASYLTTKHHMLAGTSCVCCHRRAFTAFIIRLAQQMLCRCCYPHYCRATVYCLAAILTLYSAYYIAPNSHPRTA